MRRSPLFLLLLLIGAVIGGALLAGCEKSQVVGGQKRPKYYRKIVSLSPSTTEIIASEGLQLAGRTQACNYPTGVERAPIVAGVKPDYEALARVKPDLIVYDKALYGDADIQKIKSLGIQTFEFNPDSLDSYQRAVYEMGSLCAVETNAADMVKKVREAATNAAESGTGIKVAIVMPDAGKRHMIAGSKGFLADVVSKTGATLVGPQGDKFAPLDPEFLVRENPDLVILAGDGNAFVADGRFANLAAMKARQVKEIDPNVILRRGARVESLLRNLAKATGLAVASKRTAN